MWMAGLSMFAVLSCRHGSDSPSASEPEAAVSSYFLDLYSNVFAGNCALPACHDGSFEPNFTSAQSMYYTTVLHPVIKSSMDSAFAYRVVPYDTAASVLMERITNCCFVNENDRMPVLMDPLSDDQIDSISVWILAGAPDWRGEFPYAKDLP